MVVIPRPGEDGWPTNAKQPLFNILRGYLQALLLVGMTFLFGSTSRGDFFDAGLFIFTFITLVVISRTYSIYFCWWMESVLGATLIKYDTLTELRAIRTILAGMPGVLVESVTDSYKYSAGYRLGVNSDCRNHDTPIARVNFRTVGRVLGVIIGPTIALAPLAVSGRILASPSVVLVNFLSILVFLGLSVTLGFFVSQKIISDFDFIETHAIRLNTKASIAV